jgi:hypothetical protein
MRQFIIKCSRAVFGWPPAPANVAEKQSMIMRKARDRGLKVFVETGTFRGDMIAAQRENFDQLISIELSDKLFADAQARFAGDKRVQLLHGDSGTLLRTAVAKLEQPALFWLDAHYSRGETAGGNQDAPIIRELSCLVGRNQPRETILIDDARLFGLKSGYPKLKVIREFAAQHWPQHSFAVESDIICIQPPVSPA